MSPKMRQSKKQRRAKTSKSGSAGIYVVDQDLGLFYFKIAVFRCLYRIPGSSVADGSARLASSAFSASSSYTF